MLSTRYAFLAATGHLGISSSRVCAVSMSPPFAVLSVFAGSWFFATLQMALGLISDIDADESMIAVVLFLCGGSLQAGGGGSCVVVRLLIT